MEVESVKCECCGLKEDCTQDYISAVKDKFEGKWLCGLCAEAVRYEVSRGKKAYGVDEAVRAHMSFCGKFKSNPAVRVADGMKQMLRRRSGDLSSTSKKFMRSASTSQVGDNSRCDPDGATGFTPVLVKDDKTTVKRQALAEFTKQEESISHEKHFPSSTVKSAVTGERSESRDSCYFPGCRKDMNCNCEVCLSSIEATLHLRPSSIQGSSLTKISNPESAPIKTPISFNPRFLSTYPQNEQLSRRKFCFWIGFSGRFLLGFSLIFMTEFGFPWVVSGTSEMSLSPEIVNSVAQESEFVEDLNGKLDILQRKLGDFVHRDVAKCSASDSNWELNWEGLQLLHSRCILYKSAAKEVSIWGWPLQTAGVLAAGFSSRLFTILLGRITEEWPEGRMEAIDKKANNSWTEQNWSVSSVQLQPNTWIV